MRDIYFDLIEHKAVLKTNENGWSREVNVVAWNGGKPKLDIRDWSDDHKRMSRGITLEEAEAEKLIAILRECLPDPKKFPSETPDECLCSIDECGISIKILSLLGKLSVNKSGWTKEVAICSWNGGKPKLDIREWAPGHRRMSRGIQLSCEEASALAETDPAFDAEALLKEVRHV